ncbi:DUF3106 domain-containing protein [Pseudoxanthomonas sp. JBR18]|uniref:DUF3106 domain-containing protein n=1 Tax=Pseudoxanthomonas sp. JBR18 TaxID=2969308 RepID=UPI0023052B44|nr:DUF3106 domain-containing protein [Pseudoxanthomonas sp. JBR18]WCE04850.1 DUF3106 domain-containing protein [Pseudoxanthomonas sp. JBR18]
MRPRSALALIAGALAVVTMTLVAQAGDEGANLSALQAQRAARLAVLDEAGRAAFARRMVAWDALPPLERARQRAAYADWMALDAQTRARLSQAAAILSTLPPAQRQAMQARFDALDQTDQAGWRLGPDLGADYAKLHPLLAFMPEAERQPLLAALRQMTAPQRADLAVLAQRTPPQERDALRQDLIATTAQDRDRWLQERLRR